MVDRNSKEGSDRTIGLLHMLMIIAFIWARVFNNLVEMLILNLNRDKVYAYKYHSKYEMAAHFNSIVSEFIAFMILLFMFWRYTLL